MAHKGNIPWNKGKKGVQICSEETRKKMIETRSKMNYKGEHNPAWKGEKVKYRGIHMWVQRWKGKPDHCEMCGAIGGRKYQWANIDHKYRRVLEDYISTCVSCHRKYDIKLKNINK